MNRSLIGLHFPLPWTREAKRVALKLGKEREIMEDFEMAKGIERALGVGYCGSCQNGYRFYIRGTGVTITGKRADNGSRPWHETPVKIAVKKVKK